MEDRYTGSFTVRDVVAMAGPKRRSKSLNKNPLPLIDGHEAIVVLNLLSFMFFLFGGFNPEVVSVTVWSENISQMVLQPRHFFVRALIPYPFRTFKVCSRRCLSFRGISAFLFNPSSFEPTGSQCEEWELDQCVAHQCCAKRQGKTPKYHQKKRSQTRGGMG